LKLKFKTRKTPPIRIAFLERSVLWHNGARRKFTNMSWRFLNGIVVLCPCAIRCLAALGIAAILLSAAPASHAQNAAPASGNADSGKKIFTKDGCYECHGLEGQGAAQGAGPRIGPPQLSFDAFTKYVHQPAGQMPPYTAKVVTDQDLADIYAYLQSRPKAPPSKDIPLLNQ
jgi:ubiquinol-cytochrome c reductase cytochrome c subunit